MAAPIHHYHPTYFEGIAHRTERIQPATNCCANPSLDRSRNADGSFRVSCSNCNTHWLDFGFGTGLVHQGGVTSFERPTIRAQNATTLARDMYIWQSNATCYLQDFKTNPVLLDRTEPFSNDLQELSRKLCKVGNYYTTSNSGYERKSNMYGELVEATLPLAGPFSLHFYYYVRSPDLVDGIPHWAQAQVPAFSTVHPPPPPDLHEERRDASKRNMYGGGQSSISEIISFFTTTGKRIWAYDVTLVINIRPIMDAPDESKLTRITQLTSQVSELSVSVQGLKLIQFDIFRPATGMTYYLGYELLGGDHFLRDYPLSELAFDEYKSFVASMVALGKKMELAEAMMDYFREVMGQTNLNDENIKAIAMFKHKILEIFRILHPDLENEDRKKVCKVFLDDISIVKEEDVFFSTFSSTERYCRLVREQKTALELQRLKRRLQEFQSEKRTRK